MTSHKTPASGTPPAASGDSGSDGSAIKLEAQLKELSEKLRQMTGIAARAQADLQNAKIRMQKDGDALRAFAAESVLRKLLPILDSLQRALRHLPDDLTDNDWAKGVQSVEREFMRQLHELGLRRMEALGQQVDTARHEVVTLAPGKEGEIVEVIEDGYELHGKVLRPAKVIVGDGVMPSSAAA